MSGNVRSCLLTLVAVLALGSALTLHSQVRGQAPPAAAAPGRPPQAARGGPCGGSGPGTEEGIAQFELKSSSCHNNPVLDLTPSASAIRELPPERILASM